MLSPIKFRCALKSSRTATPEKNFLREAVTYCSNHQTNGQTAKKKGQKFYSLNIQPKKKHIH